MHHITSFLFLAAAIAAICSRVYCQDDETSYQSSGCTPRLQVAIQQLHSDLEAIKAHDQRTRAVVERFRRRNAVRLSFLYQTIGVRGNLEPTFQAAEQTVVDRWQLTRQLHAQQAALVDRWMARVRSDWFGALPPATQRNELAQFYWRELGDIPAEAADELAGLIDEHANRSLRDLRQAIAQLRRLQLWSENAPQTKTDDHLHEKLAAIQAVDLTNFFDYWAALMEGHGQRALRLVLATQALEV